MSIIDFYSNSRKLKTVQGKLRKPQNLQTAYDIQHKNLKFFDKVVGWKLGGTTETTRRLFQTDSVYYGPIFNDSLFHISQTNSRLTLQRNPILGEAEIAFELSERIEQLSKVSEKDIKAEDFIHSVMPSLELPWSVFPLPESGLEVLIADMCGTGGAICGTPINKCDGIVSTGQVSITANAEIIGNGVVENILDGPLKALELFIRIAKKNTLDLKAGQIIFTGGITPCVRLPKNEKIEVKFEKLGKFEFSFC